MTAAELRDFREVKAQTVPAGQALPGIPTLAVGTVRIRTVPGASQPISASDWPGDATRTVPVIAPKPG